VATPSAASVAVPAAARETAAVARRPTSVGTAARADGGSRTRAWARLVVSVAAGLALGLAGALAAAGPAAAHAVGGDAVASSYRSRVTAVEGLAEGSTDAVRARVIGNEGVVELANGTAATVVVLGYEGEPYLRLGPDGAFENVRSPATWINRTASGGVEPGPGADAGAAPEWRRIGPDPVARWHDHRTHWMSPLPPPVVEREPGTPHVLQPRWVVPIEVDGEPAAVVGELAWVPAPSAAPWWALAVALAVVSAAAVASRWWRPALVVASVVLLAATWADVAGVWQASVAPALDKASGLVTLVVSTAALLAGVAALRRRPRLGLALVVVGAALVALDHGITGWAYLSSSQIDSALPAWVARATVAVAAGVGGGVAAAGVVRLLGLRRPVPAVPA
jgi:hypothetical protein